MFDVAPTELMLVALVALVVIGPKDLPRLMRVVGQWVARARGMARHFRSGMDEMIRQAEIEEMERKWAEENARIMREHPPLREEGAPTATPLADVVETETEPTYSAAPASEGSASDESEGRSLAIPAAPQEFPPEPPAPADTSAALPPAPSSQAELPFGGAQGRPA